MSHEDTHCSSGCGHDESSIGLPRPWLVGISGLMTGTGILLDWLHLAPGWVVAAAFAVATISGGLLVFPAAFRALRGKRLDMNVLMTVAVAGAWTIGEHGEAASVVFLFALSEWLESWAEGRARKAIGSLLELAPDTAAVRGADGKFTEVPVSSLPTGAEFLVKSGGRIALDGVVIDGQSAVNQAPITGESVPVDKQPLDEVFAGTINGNGSLVIRATKVSSDTTLSRIIKLVEEAGEQKAPTQRFVDKFAAIYTPAVFLLALAVALIPPLLMQAEWSLWIYRSLVLLVIACPCALVIATPVTIVSGLTAMARKGVLIKGGAVLESLGKIRALALDKTGTITSGKPVVTEVFPFGGQSRSDILAKAAAIDVHSEHPLAVAVTRAAEQEGIQIAAATNYEASNGLGASGLVDGHPLFIGNHRMAHESGVCTPEVEKKLQEIEESGQSLAVLGHRPHEGCAGEILGVLAIGDTVRPEAAEALRLLHAAGIEKVVMLSGDNQRTASAIASQVGIDVALGDLLPDQKVDALNELLVSYRYVGMIGDGVNDAPALALASVGIAMGGIGSDTAIETADMTLMKDDLRKVASSIVLGRRVVSIIRFNVGFALLVKAVFLILAFLGYAGLWMAILADTGATLLVIVNSLRLLKATDRP